MIVPIPWTQREFTFDLPLRAFPTVLERLRGTPARAIELVEALPEEVLSRRVNGKWSVKEHLGHLVDLEALDEERLREFQRGVAVLSAADISNRATEAANHRETPIADLVKRLHVGRIALVQQLEDLTADEVAMIAIHPRLRKPMRLMDWACFVAEHDDHHLAWARRTIRDFAGFNPQRLTGKGGDPVLSHGTSSFADGERLV